MTLQEIDHIYQLDLFMKRHNMTYVASFAKRWEQAKAMVKELPWMAKKCDGRITIYLPEYYFVYEYETQTVTCAFYPQSSNA